MPRMQRKNKALALRKLVHDFLAEPTVSMPLPDTRHVGKRYLTDSLKRIYRNFLEVIPPGFKCSFSHFCKLRPWKTIKKTGQTPKRMCVCEDCENVSLMAACMLRAGVVGLELNIGATLDKMWCPHSGRHPRYACVEGSCEKCGPELFRRQIVVPDNIGKKIVTWKEWGTVVKTGEELVKSGPPKEIKGDAKMGTKAEGKRDAKNRNKLEKCGGAKIGVGRPAKKREIRQSGSQCVGIKRKRAGNKASGTKRRKVESESEDDLWSCSEAEGGDVEEKGKKRTNAGRPVKKRGIPQSGSQCVGVKRKRAGNKASGTKRRKVETESEDDLSCSDAGGGDVEEKGKKTKLTRVDLVEMKSTVHDLMGRYIDLVWSLRHHHFLSNWQLHQYRRFRIELQVGTILQVVDFSQNYLHIYQDEPTGSHWDHNQTTMFPCVNEFRCPDRSCPKLITLEQMFFSPSKDHTHFAVESFVAKGIEELKELGVEIKDIHRWSDNCGKQFKSKGPFKRCALSKIPITLSFYGERHGKSLADGSGGRTKLAIQRARDGRSKVFQNAADLLNFCREELQSPQSDFDKLRDGMCGSHFSKSHFLRSFHLIEKHDFSLDVPKTGVQGTTRFHSVRSTGDSNTIETRDISCTCRKCYYGIGPACPNLEYTSDWVSRALVGRKKRVRNTHFPLNKGESLVREGDDEEQLVAKLADDYWPRVVLSPLSLDLNKPSVMVTPDLCMSTTRHVDDDAMSLIEVISERSSESEAESDASVEIVGESLTQFDESATPGWSDPFVLHCEPARVADVSERGAFMTDYSDVSADEMFPGEAIDHRQTHWKLLYKEIRRCKTFEELEQYSTQRKADLQHVQFTTASWASSSSSGRDCFASIPCDAPENRVPVETGGDGNCLLRAVSTHVTGREGMHLELRCRVAMELAVNKDRYVSFDERFPQYSAQWHAGMSPMEVFKADTFNFRLMKTYSGPWALAALANVLRRPVLSVYPLANLRDLNRVFEPFDTRFRRREPVIVLWVNTGLVWHFVPLLKLDV